MRVDTAVGHGQLWYAGSCNEPGWVSANRPGMRGHGKSVAMLEEEEEAAVEEEQEEEVRVGPAEATTGSSNSLDIFHRANLNPRA